MKLLLTGASGFVGRAIVSAVSRHKKFHLRTVARNQNLNQPPGVEHFVVKDINSEVDWQDVVSGVDIIIHAAARAHVLHDTSINPLVEYRQINVEGTLNLARQAVDAGVRRFIYISTIKVNGEGTSLGKPYTVDDDPAPIDPYAISKYEAELGLMQLAQETSLEVVIIRPVLVYGPGVKANFLAMIRWLHRGIPLPFGKIQNKRSLVALDNLVGLIVTCVDHPAAANRIFLISDDEDLSTTDLLRRINTALGKRDRLVPVPVGLLKMLFLLLGKREISNRLFGSLQVDISKTKQLLNWIPPVTVDDALSDTISDYLARYQS